MEKLPIASEAELVMKARISELEDNLKAELEANLKAKSMMLVAFHKDVDALKSRLADSEAAYKAMSDQFLQYSVELEKSQSSARICSKQLSSAQVPLCCRNAFSFVTTSPAYRQGPEDCAQRRTGRNSLTTMLITRVILPPHNRIRTRSSANRSQ